MTRTLTPDILNHELTDGPACRFELSTALFVFAGLFAATVAVRSLDAAPATLSLEEEAKVVTGEGSFMTEIDDPVAMGCRKNAKSQAAADPSRCHIKH